MLQHPKFRDFDPTTQLFAVFVTNKSRTVPFFKQRASSDANGFVCWDYHVFGVVVDPSVGPCVWDLDTQLPLPCPLAEYLKQAMPFDDATIKAEFRW